jgi:DNA-binding NtrC family response regulator
MSDSCRILVVDDEPDVCEITAEMLEALGHQVSAVRSSRDALHHISTTSGSYTLALIDWNMPGVPGKDVVAAINAHSPDTGVVITTGGHIPMKVQQGHGLVLRGILKKPFTLQMLRTCIEDALAPTS